MLEKIGGSIGVAFGSEGLKKFAGGIEEAAAYVSSLLEKKIIALDVETKLTQATIKNAQSIGDLNKYVKDGSIDFDALTKNIDSSRIAITNTSNATGVTVEELTALQTTITKMPMAFNSAGEAVNNFSVGLDSVKNLSGMDDQKNVRGCN